MSTPATIQRSELVRLRDALVLERDARLRKLELDAMVLEKAYTAPWRTGTRVPGHLQRDALRRLDDYISTE